MNLSEAQTIFENRIHRNESRVNDNLEKLRTICEDINDELIDTRQLEWDHIMTGPNLDVNER